MELRWDLWERPYSVQRFAELLALALLAEDYEWPGDIADEIDFRTDRALAASEQGIAACLQRLSSKEAGIVELYEAPPGMPGPPRKCYRLTPKGVERERYLRNAWEELKSAIDQVLERDDIRGDATAL